MSTYQGPLLFRIANVLFKLAPWLYTPLYFLYKRISDREKLRILSSYIRPGMHILDIGSNIGFYTLFFSKLVGPSGRVYAFEPDEQNLSVLRRTIRNCTNVTLYAGAVSDRCGALTLYRSKEMNVDHQTYDNGEGREKLEIPCTSIDEVVPKDVRIDLVKIDVQGYDAIATKGMLATLRRSPHLLMLGEFWPYGLQRSGVTPQEYLTMLESCGLRTDISAPDQVIAEHIADPAYYIDFFARK